MVSITVTTNVLFTNGLCGTGIEAESLGTLVKFKLSVVDQVPAKKFQKD